MRLAGFKVSAYGSRYWTADLNEWGDRRCRIEKFVSMSVNVKSRCGKSHCRGRGVAAGTEPSPAVSICGVAEGGIEAALLRACFVTGAVAEEYTVAPVYGESGVACALEWVVEFSHLPNDVARFAAEADAALREVVGYDAARRGGMAMPHVVAVPRGTFRAWRRKYGAGLVPHLAADRTVADGVLRCASGESAVAGAR